MRSTHQYNKISCYIKLTIMHQTIKLLSAIDTKLRKQSLASTPKNTQKKQKYPFARILDFTSQKYNQFPKWLTQREDFLQFMYKKYENKLLSIPKICQKDQKASDQKYFISLYLQQIPIFQGLPQPIQDILLNNVKTKYYPANAVVHQEGEIMQFMAVIFVGAVVYEDRNGNQTTKIKNNVIMTQAFYSKPHPQIKTKQQTVLLTFDKQLYPLIQSQLISDINEKSRDQIADMLKSDFFIQLHLKDTKAKNFFTKLKPQFYFKGENICVAGELVEKFFIIFRGELKQLNHIYVREHNKWPLEGRRWEVRAVYNSFENAGMIKEYSFFGDQEIISALKIKSTYIAQTHSILFSMQKQIFLQTLSLQDCKRLKKYRNEHVNINYSQFEKSIRQRVKSLHDKKKIIHKAIDTSFANRGQFPKRKISLIQTFEKHMLGRSGLDLMDVVSKAE